MTTDLPDHRLLSAAEETALALRIQAGDMAARNELIECNLKLVMSRVTWYARRSHVEVDELFQEGCLGLLRAAEKYDPTRGTRFSTFAVWWINQAIGRYLENAGNLVRVPVYVTQTLRVRHRVEEDLRSTLGREPTPNELDAAVLERGGVVLSQAMALAATAATSTPISFDAPVATPEGDGAPFGDFVAGPESLEADALRSALHRETAAVLAAYLPTRERWIIECTFGFHDGHCWTLDACGKELRLSRERVRQLQQRALKRLRRVLGRAHDYRRSE